MKWRSIGQAVQEAAADFSADDALSQAAALATANGESSRDKRGTTVADDASIHELSRKNRSEPRPHSAA